MTSLLDVIALVSAAALFGAMVFFSAVIAPLIFIKLDGSTAGRFIREVFPWYYLVVGFLALIAGFALVSEHRFDAAVMALIAAGAFVSRQMLMPRINRSRDLVLAGEPAAEAHFARLHRTSVWINGLQIAAALFVLIRFALGPSGS